MLRSLLLVLALLGAAEAGDGLWGGRRRMAEDAVPESLAVGAHALTEPLCLYGGDTWSGMGSSTVLWTAQGVFKGVFGAPDAGPSPLRMKTAWGMLHHKASNSLLISDGNAKQSPTVVCFLTGSVARWSLRSGKPLGSVVSPVPTTRPADFEACAPRLEACGVNATENQCVMGVAADTLRSLPAPPTPVTPEGLAYDERRSLLFVADFSGNETIPGSIMAFRWTGSGAASYAFTFDVSASKFPPIANGVFWPRALLIHPSQPRFLYATVRSLLDGTSGWILRFDIERRELDGVFAQATDAVPLHRPDGIVLGPDNNFYVTAFRRDRYDVDRVLVFNSHGKFLPSRTIPLYKANDTRLYTQGVAFDGQGKLFISDQLSGDIIRYDLSNPEAPARKVWALGDPNGVTGAMGAWNLLWAPCPGQG